MREVPMRYVKANQVGIVLFVLLSFVFNPIVVLGLLWIIQVVGLASGGKFNLFVQIGKVVLTGKGTEAQAVELQRFNNILAVLFLSLALISFSLGWVGAGYVFSVMLLAAASAALLGYCVGCTVYFWYKQLRAGRKIGF
ncbi:DUF4395 domain-containing protein [Paenibacillus sp. FSL H8-0317]|uniref:DUF4395 domain-containing protein n=1 Tax=Paenibacillus TaxID=44249 RepID=UPI0003E20EFA|nr:MULTISPECIES: DUF4395 domain-containing protein [Paenibacillus]ETT55544.1 hypothetical protein C170_02174 [Paenibacillus sp. FSL H7-689]KLU58120.1 hypothetical protein EL84_02030 [Paenibacillus sp. VT-400]MCP1424691.1 hypothetical protein [Paenibacillus xylanexedens]OME93273.1 hypothetical protein BK124_25265 [Paenibacillus amylolyticus]OMF01009.1 hypothetical protein BK129_26055 [Paenibacillus amylolyticus]